jgi:hypothetical protein
MNKNKVDIEDWWSLFYNPICTFIDPDGSLLKGKNVQYDQINEVLYQHEELDTWDWRGEALVTLHNGDFAYLTGWSETTFDGADHFIAESLETLFKYAMSPEEEKIIKETMKEGEQ